MKKYQKIIASGFLIIILGSCARDEIALTQEGSSSVNTQAELQSAAMLSAIAVQ